MEVLNEKKMWANTFVILFYMYKLSTNAEFEKF